MNLTNKSFTKNIYKILNKNLNFVPTKEALDKKMFDKEINDSYRHIKLKAHFKDTASNQDFTEDKVLKNPSSKS